MVSKPEIDEEEEEAFCVVRDFSGASQHMRISLNVSNSTTGREFVQEVAKRFNFEPSSFRLVSPTPNKKNDSYQAVLTEESEELLKDVGVVFEKSARNLFVVEGLNGCAPRLLNKEDDLELGASASPEEPSSSNSYSPPIPPPLIIQQEQDVQNVSFKYCRTNRSLRHRGKFDDISRKSPLRSVSPLRSEDYFYAPGYRGLVNQAMTCYLNSLLQALFMTPEFRNALYNWKFLPSSDSDESKSIPYQLQRLFLNLQTSPRPSVETTDLTRSFGWDSSEAWQQHDIQELCRVMFDALEQEFKGTEQADLINRLYQGKMTDYVKCLECGTEKSREDTFLDIPLPVRPFGSTTAYGSVEEALQAFVQPELLQGNDQYFCEKCDKKCNAHKGLKFIKFPYLLTLHLMRFDFDYNTMHRIKLSDKVVFPETLNLNSFVPLANLTTSNMYKEDGSEGFPEEITGSSGKCDDSSTTDSGSAIDDETCMTSSNDLNNVDSDQDIDEGIDVSNQHENESKNRCHGMETGPYVYELFSIMVHSGSASGGHYYVYIKDFNTGEWICFNDQTVTKITRDDIDRSFGGYGGPSRGYYSGVYSSSMNAYMLMYRQIDRERNVLPLKEHEFPPHITTLLKELNEKAETDRRVRECEKEVHKIKVYIIHPTLNKELDCKVEYSSNTTIRELTQIAFKKLQLETVVSLDQCRLVVYIKAFDAVENCLDGKENERIESLLHASANVSRKIELLMEVRQPHETFPIYKPNAVPLKLRTVDLENGVVSNPINIRTSLSNYLPSFKEELLQLGTFQFYRSSIMLLNLQMPCNAGKFLEDETVSLRMLGVEANSTVFVSFIAESDTSLTLCRQKMRGIIQRFFSTLKLNISLPDIKPEVFKKMSIPTLTEFYNSCNDNNQKQNENCQPEKDMCYMNGETSSGEPAQTSNEDDMSEFMNVLPCSIVGHRSDQSASEDSSLTDSDRTIVGGNPDEYQMSSPSLSPQSHDIRYTNDASGEDEIGVENTNVNKTSLVPSICISDSSSKIQSENYDFEVLNQQTVRDEKCLTILVHKCISIIDFKKNLEPYIRVPYPYFECVLNSAENGDDVSLVGDVISSLKNLEGASTLYCRLAYPSKPGTLRGRLHLLSLNNDKCTIEPLDKFNIEENCTVADTKRKFLQGLRIIRKIDLCFERCLIRKMISNGPGQVYPDERTWKELGLESNWKLILQELDANDVAEARYCVMIRSHNSAENVAGPLQQIFFNKSFNLVDLKTKISEMTEIPAENLSIGDQLWSDALMACSRSLSTNVNRADVDWWKMSEITDSDELLDRLAMSGRIIYYRDDRDQTSNYKVKIRNRKRGGDHCRILSTREKNLTIRVTPKTISNSDEGRSSEITSCDH